MIVIFAENSVKTVVFIESLKKVFTQNRSDTDAEFKASDSDVDFDFSDDEPPTTSATKIDPLDHSVRQQLRETKNLLRKNVF